MGRYKSENPLDCRMAISCDRETKDFFRNMAEARGITVSRLLMGLISDGAKLEKQRRQRIRQLANQVVTAHTAKPSSLDSHPNKSERSEDEW